MYTRATERECDGGGGSGTAAAFLPLFALGEGAIHYLVCRRARDTPPSIPVPCSPTYPPSHLRRTIRRVPTHSCIVFSRSKRPVRCPLVFACGYTSARIILYILLIRREILKCGVLCCVREARRHLAGYRA
jgi:hypothetical protein